MCPHCRSLEWDSLESSGEGTLHTFSVVHHPRVEGFPSPYIVGLIDLPEGIRFLSNVVEVQPRDLTIGMPMRITYAKISDEVTLPLLTKAK